MRNANHVHPEVAEHCIGLHLQKNISATRVLIDRRTGGYSRKQCAEFLSIGRRRIQALDHGLADGFVAIPAGIRRWLSGPSRCGPSRLLFCILIAMD